MNDKKWRIVLGMIIIVLLIYIMIREITVYKGNQVYSEDMIMSLQQENLALRTMNEEDRDLYNSEVDSLNEEVANLQHDMDDYTTDISQLRNTLVEAQKELEKSVYPDAYTIEALKEMGVFDYTIIENDLYERGSKLIGFEGVLGGTMRFDTVKIISPYWAYGYFEDGHIMGRGLYEFNVDDEGAIQWHVIKEFID